MIGCQEPRIRVEPPRSRSDGEDAALLMEAYGCRLDPWQRSVLDCWLGRDEHGEYNVTSAGLAVPRQNGKNVCLEARELFGIKPGDTLLILGDEEMGLIVSRPEVLSDLADKILNTAAKEV